jgi:hypothetical protein
MECKGMHDWMIRGMIAYCTDCGKEPKCSGCDGHFVGNSEFDLHARGCVVLDCDRLWCETCAPSGLQQVLDGRNRNSIFRGEAVWACRGRHTVTALQRAEANNEPVGPATARHAKDSSDRAFCLAAREARAALQ